MNSCPCSPFARSPFPLAPHTAYRWAVFALLWSGVAHANTAILQPPREVAATQPLELTLLYSDDSSAPLSIDVPQHFDITLSNGDLPPIPLALQREAGVPDHLSLSPGQYRKVRFSAPWPAAARGSVKVDAVGIDTSPMLVTLNRGDNQLQTVAAAHAEMAPGTPQPVALAAAAQALPVQSAPLSPMLSGRLSTFEPIYFADGQNGDNLAKFQFSFKYRLMVPDDPSSRSLFDNLYFGYTQTSIWDLSAASAPFRDTSYEPQLFYYLQDTGWKNPLFTRMGIAAGIGHESNGQAGSTSRSIDILYLRPTWDFGNLDSYHLTISPKAYYYLSKSGNEDIQDYRGYVDLMIKYGSPEGWQLATTLRKGTKSSYGSIDTNLTYPLAKLFGSAWGGYVWVGYFTGYGEDILDYNQHQHSIARIGYSITR